MKKYTTVLIDLDNTLLDFYAAEKNAHKYMSEELNLPWSEKLYTTYSKINDSWWGKFESKEYTKNEIIINRFIEYLKLVNSNLSPILVNEKYKEGLFLGKQEIEGATELIKYLHSIGVKIIIVTNGNVEVQEHRLEGKEFMKYVDGYIVSEAIGFPKPSIDYFNVIKETYDIKFDSQTIIIGDSLRSDIKGGNLLNIDTIWFNKDNLPMEEGYKVTYEVHSLEEIKGIIV